MSARRPTADLYAPGAPLGLRTASGEVRVWIQKLSKLDQRTAARKAGAAKAVIASQRRNPDSELRAELAEEVAEHEAATLVGFVIREELDKRQQSIAARLENEEVDGEPSVWGRDGYLEGLYVAWQGDGDHPGLRDRWQEDPDDPEAARVFSELKRFNAEVNEAIAVEEAELRREWEGAERADLEAKVIEILAKDEEEAAWDEEYKLCKVWLCTRVCDCPGRCTGRATDHMERYFPSRAHVDLADDWDPATPGGRSPDGVVGQILAAIASLEVGVSDTKDSPASPASSPSSEPPAEQAQEDPSSLAAAPA